MQMTVDGGVTMVQPSTPPLSPDPSSVVCRKFGVLWFVLRIQFQSEYVSQKPLSAPLRLSVYFDFSNCRYLPSGGGGGGGGDLFAPVDFELPSRNHSSMVVAMVAVKMVATLPQVVTALVVLEKLVVSCCSVALDCIHFAGLVLARKSMAFLLDG